MDNTRNAAAVALLGRIFLAAIYVVSGVNKVMDPEATKGYMASKGMPLIPLMFLGAVLLEIGGGLSILLGIKARFTAALLILFTLATALIFHNFWAVPSAEAQNQMAHFMKNLSIIGGFLMVVAFGPGLFSFDARRAARASGQSVNTTQ